MTLLALAPTAQHAVAQTTTTWNGGAADANGRQFGVAANWSNGVPDASKTAVFNSSSATNVANVEVAGDVASLGLRFNSLATSPVTINDDGLGSSTITILGNIFVDAAAAKATLGLATLYPNSGTIEVNNTDGLDIAQSFTANGSVLTKTGAGALNLLSETTFGGSVAINGGAINIKKALSLTDSASVTLSLSSNTVLDRSGNSPLGVVSDTDPYFGVFLTGNGTAGISNLGTISATSPDAASRRDTAAISGTIITGDISNSGSILANGGANTTLWDGTETNEAYQASTGGTVTGILAGQFINRIPQAGGYLAGNLTNSGTISVTGSDADYLGGESIGIYTVDQRGVIRNTATGLIEVHGGTGLNADAFGGGATGYFGDITTNSPNFYNDGIIRAYAADGFGGGDSYGIVTGGQISGSGGATNLGILSNTGRITATGGNATGTGEYSEGGEAYGVYIDTANAFTNTGSGIIEATGGSGVEGAGGAAESVLFTASVANATNAGQITAVGGSSVDGDGAYGYGMDVSETLSVFDNTGTISGTGGASDSGGGGEGGGSMLTSCRM